jgi:hypothetical protein
MKAEEEEVDVNTIPVVISPRNRHEDGMDAGDEDLVWADQDTVDKEAFRMKVLMQDETDI